MSIILKGDLLLNLSLHNKKGKLIMKEKLTKCSVCGADISSKAKKCPACGGKIKKPFYKTVWFWVLAIIVIAIIGNALGGGDDTDSKASESKNTEEKKTSYNIGETAYLNGANITVNKIQKDSGSAYEKPKAGHEFVIVEVTITNSSKSNITYNPYDFTMQNSQGNITDFTFHTGDRDTDLSSGELAPGGTV
ncbi:MAG: DUF4352 domain-containing protein, partial [Oscillospiraceae bacterium]